MDEIRRLIRVAAARNAASDYVSTKFRVLRSLNDSFRRRCSDEGVSSNVVIEAFIRGYMANHPGAMSLLDQWMRDENQLPLEKKGPRLSKRDLDEIYAVTGDGLINDEE